MATVTMPDGTAVEMPDQIDPALGARLRAFQQKSALPKSGGQSTGDTIAESTLGPSEILANPVLNVAHLAAHGLYNLLTGGKPDPSIIASGALGPIPVGEAGQNLLRDLKTFIPQGNPNNAADQIQAARNQTLGTPSDTVQNVMEHTGRVASDVGDIMPAAGLVKGAAGIAAEGAGAAAPAIPAAVTKYGLKTGEDQAAARNFAGASGRHAVSGHNQEIADPTMAAQVGVAPGQPPSVKNLEAAKDEPNEVYSRVERALPAGPLTPNAAQMVQNVGANDMVVHSPDTQAMIEAQKARLLGTPEEPRVLTGPELVEAQRALRYTGFRNKNLEDPENQALGGAQLKLADAVHQHMVETLPPNADVSVEQLTQARQRLAQIHTLQDAARGNNIDLQRLAKFHRDNPGLLTGPMADFAEFADLHPEVSSLPSKEERFNPSGVAKDIASVDLKRPITYLQPLVGAAARRALTGPKVVPPTTGLAADLSPIDRTPQPPPGMTASPPTGAPPPAAGPPGEIPLADLLSHGVEQNPPQGLSLAPEGAPSAQVGIPFVAHPEAFGAKIVRGGPAQPPVSRFINDQEIAPEPHEGIPLGDRFATSDAPRSPLNPHNFPPEVRSEGVPDGTVQRTAPRPSPEPAEGGGFVFRSPNGQTIARKRGDTLQISASLTQQNAQGAGQGTRRMLDAYNFARANGLRLVSDTKVSKAAAKIYDRLEQQGFHITRNPVEDDGKGNFVSTAGRPAFEVEGPSDLGAMLGGSR